MTRTQAKAQKILNAWTSLAPDAVFGGFTRSMFSAIVANGAAVAATRLAQTEARKANIAARETADTVTAEKIQQVVWSVLGNPDFGPSSALYVAMGYEQSKAPLDLTNYGREVGEGWTPDVLLPRFWLDAARPGAVAEGLIKDRSIYGHHLQRFGPVAVDQLGGLPSISLPTLAYLKNDTLVLDPPFTILLVYRHYENSGIRHYIGSGHTQPPIFVTFRHTVGDNSWQTITRGIDEGDGSTESMRVLGGNYHLNTSPHFVVHTSSFNQSSIRVDGGRVTGGGELGAEGLRGLFIGSRPLGGEVLWFNGSMAEVLVLQGVPAPDTITRLEGYAAWKWNMTEVLPTGHPYAYTKPQK
jgi:hypothetical protein